VEKQTLLNIEDLILKFYTYEGIVEALDGVDLNLKEGETLGVVGETGCGKSVTGLSTLVLVPSPGKIEGGRVFFGAKDKSIDLLKQDDAFLRKIRGKDISMIFQDPRSALNPVYTVENQITEVFMHHRIEELCGIILEGIEKDLQNKKTGPLGSLILRFERSIFTRMQKNPKSNSIRILGRIPIVNRYRGKLRKVVRKEVVKVIQETEIPDPDRVADMYPHELSGGMAQRVVIAMALACNPTILIADEPTTNLDVTVQAQILHLIRRLKEKFGSSIQYITHDMGVIAEMCDRVAVMYGGVVCEIANVMEIFKNPLHPYTKALLESLPRPGKEFKSIRGIVPSLINPPPGCRFQDRCDNATEICLKIKPKLIEVKKGHFVKCHVYSRDAE
jgi:peptide/nickel transport system ATP-binding protein